MAVDLEQIFAPVSDRRCIGLAVSGGNDSLALMVLIRDWVAQKAPRPKILVYAVDHQLRSAAADEVRGVCALALRFGFEARALRWDAQKPKTGVQMAARLARYKLIGDAMATDGAEILLTGHHRNDQAETLLMRLAHGSGLAGLGGMRAFSSVEDVEIFRPLLALDRAVLSHVVQANGLTVFHDPSNTDPKYERVRWRQAQPILDDLGLTAPGLVRFGLRVQRANAALDSLRDEVFGSQVRRDIFGGFSITHASLHALPEEIGLRLLAKMIGQAGGSVDSQKLAGLENLYARLKADAFSDCTLDGCCVIVRSETVYICREPARISPKLHRLNEHAILHWDDRFDVTSKDLADLTVQPALGLTRARAQQFIGRRIDAPMACVHGAPLISNQQGDMLALGQFCVDPRLTVSARPELEESPKK